MIGSSVGLTQKLRKCRCTFECFLEQVRISVRFPCRISVCWNYGEGEVRTAISKPLVSGVARFQERLQFSTALFLEQESQKFKDLKSIIEVSIITDNGTSLAGIVPLDLGGLINRKDHRQLFQIQRCPDKSAAIRMRLAYTTQDRHRVRPKILNSDYEDEFQDNQQSPSKPLFRSATPRSEYQSKNMLTKRTVRMAEHSSSRNKDIVEKEMMILKGRATEFESRLKVQKAEKQKLSEVLKSKEDLFFTLKTEIKRKEIELSDIMRSLQQYKIEYERTKAEHDTVRKQYDKLQRVYESTDKASTEKFSRLDATVSDLERKNQKLQSQLDRMKKEKDGQSMTIRHKTQELIKQRDNLNETVRLLRKERESMQFQIKSEKELRDKTVYEAQKKMLDAIEELEVVRNNLAAFQKKSNRQEEIRLDEISKLKHSLSQSETVRETLRFELENLKITTSKKEQSLTESIKSLELKLADEKSSNMRLKSQLTQIKNTLSVLQFDHGSLQRSNMELTQRLGIAEDTRTKLQKEAVVSKAQICTLTENLHDKTQELRSLSNRHKEFQELSDNKMNKLQQTIDQMLIKMNKIEQQKRSEEVRGSNLTKQLQKKQKELEEWVTRQNRLSTQVEGLRQDMRKLQAAYREKIEEFRRNQTVLKEKIYEVGRQLEQLSEESQSKIKQQNSLIIRLEHDLNESQETVATLTEQDHHYRMEITRLHNEVNDLLEYKSISEVNEEKNRDLEWRIEQLNQQIRVKALTEGQLAKSINQYKEKILDLESDVSRKESVVKQKDKTIGSLSKQIQQDQQEQSRQLQMRENESKLIQSDLKEILRKERMKVDELLIEQERCHVELQQLRDEAEKSHKIHTQLQSEIKSLKQSQKQLNQEKSLLLKTQDELEAAKMESEEQRILQELKLSEKDKEIKLLKQQNLDKQHRMDDQFKQQQRNSVILSEILDYATRLQVLGSLTIIEEETQTPKNDSEAQKLLKVKKLVMSAQARMRRQLDLSMERQEMLAREKSKQTMEGQKITTQLTKLKQENSRLQKQFEQLAFTNNFIKIEHEQQTAKLQHIEHQLSQAKKLQFQLEIRLKAETQEKQANDQEHKTTIHRYQQLLDETRTTLSERGERQRKEMLVNIKKLEQKSEQLQQKLFLSELECQKLPQLIKREEEFKKLQVKVVELEREVMRTHQESNLKCEEMETEHERLRWDKKLMQETYNSMQSKSDKMVTQLQAELDAANTKTKAQATQIRQLEEQARKHEQATQRLQQDLSTAKNHLKEEQQRHTTNANKHKSELNKLKTEISNLKKTIEQQDVKLHELRDLKVTHQATTEQLTDRQGKLHQLQQKEQKISEELFKLKQRLDEMTWENQKKLQEKENEIQALQQEMFKLNSKENLRYLRESQNQEKIKQLEHEKRTNLNQINKMKEEILDLEEQIRIIQNENSILKDMHQQNKVSSWDSNIKQGDIIAKLQDEIYELKGEKSRLKSPKASQREIAITVSPQQF